MKPTLIVILPTYNEAENIHDLCYEILAQNNMLEILVVDDYSPDKTYKIVEKISMVEPRVHLLLRKDQRGRGYAGIAGFKKALEFKPDYILEMDADFSHNPKYIPNFLKNALESKVVIGSRFVNAGLDTERTFSRKFISIVAKTFLSVVLGIQVKDPTSGYRLFHIDVIKSILPLIKAGDPFIVTEILYYCHKMGFSIKEIPINFEERRYGASKLKLKTLIKYFFQVLKLKMLSKSQ